MYDDNFVIFEDDYLDFTYGYDGFNVRTDGHFIRTPDDFIKRNYFNDFIISKDYNYIKLLLIDRWIVAPIVSDQIERNQCTIYQKCADGVYCFKFNFHTTALGPPWIIDGSGFYFVPNEILGKHVLEFSDRYSKIIRDNPEEYYISILDDYRFCSYFETWCSKKFDFPKFEISDFSADDIYMICNKISHIGLDKIAKNGKIEFNDEDRKKYAAYREERKSDVKSKTDDTVIEKKDVNVIDNEVVNQLLELKNLGIELTVEQEQLISKLSKLSKYREGKEEREKHQKEVLMEHKELSQKREEWHDSPENPSNIRSAEFETLRRQMEVLKKIDSKLLSSEQKQYLFVLETFFGMKSKADSKVHEVDTGMDEDIRKWYQDAYGLEENSKKR